MNSSGNQQKRAELVEYYFAHDELVVLPIEHLSRRGMTSELRSELLGRAVFSEAWCDLFDQAYSSMWQRLAELHRTMPEEWFPPRVQHVCVVRDGGSAPAAVRPYFEPFHRCAWLVYEEDFDPELSNLEFAVFQLLQVARMGVVQQVAPAFIHNLSYWFTRDEPAVSEFARGCACSPRPDAAAYSATARIAGRVGELYHQRLKPPSGVVTSEASRPADPGRLLERVPETGLIAAPPMYGGLQQLAQTCERTVRAVARSYFSGFGDPDPVAAEELCSWLVEHRPRVVITGRKEAAVLWCPESEDPAAAVQAALGPLSRSAAASIRADLEVIGARSSAFVESLAPASILPRPDAEHADQDGLSYMHLERREIAYNLDESGMRRRLEPAPPYERFMLGARTVHEWAHLATEAGWVDVPDRLQADFQLGRRQVADLFDRVVAGSSASLRDLCATSLEAQARGGTPGEGLAELALARVEDFQSNLLASRYLTASERETYVRNNVRSHAGEFAPQDRFQELARNAYEFQYLRFSGVEDAWGYFVSSTWFAEQFIAPGLLGEELAVELFGALGRLFDLFEVDESRFARQPEA